MTDRELLENAAKAAGVVGEYESWTYQGFNEGIRQVLNGIKCWKPWNPLTDDGDALRLAVKLQMCIGIVPSNIVDGYATVALAPANPVEIGETHNGDIFETHNDDPLAATRRTIVRAAAEIGRRMT